MDIWSIIKETAKSSNFCLFCDSIDITLCTALINIGCNDIAACGFISSNPVAALTFSITSLNLLEAIISSKLSSSPSSPGKA